MQFQSAWSDKTQSEIDLRQACTGKGVSNDAFSCGDAGKKFGIGLHAVGKSGEQTWPRFLSGKIHAGLFGKKVYIFLGQSGKSER